MNNISFVSVTDDHVKRITQIYNYYIRNTTVTFHYSEHTEAQMKEIIYSKDPRFNSFAIIDDNKGEVIGYCLICRFKNREAYDICGEVTLYIDNGYLGRGIGKQA